MSYGYEMRAGISSTYGRLLPEKPRDMQISDKPRQVTKPILRKKSDGMA